MGTERVPSLKGERRRREARYEELVELAPDGIIIHDGDVVVFGNAAAVHLAGAANLDEFVGQPISRFLNPPYLKAVEARILESTQTAEAGPAVRDTFRRIDGSTVEVEVTAIAFLEQGNLSAHVVIRDVTERLVLQRAARIAEERLARAQKLESVGSLAGGVAHEVNNMMAVVLGFSELLLKDAGLSEDRRADARQIAIAAERAATVTRQLLAFSRRAFHRPQLTDLGAVVRDAEPIIRRLLGANRALVLEIGPTPRVLVDQAQLAQVLINLSLNARDAMPAGGTLTLAVSEQIFPVNQRQRDDTVILAGRYGAIIVHDTGPGIDRAIQTQIFEPFFTTKPVGQGAGLGLAAAYGIMQQNHGHISVASEPGDGAAFTLLLPAAVDAVSNIDPALPAAGGSDGPGDATILVVEDERAVRSIVVRTLERAGFHVFQAASCADALELTDRNGPPDLVLTDVVMPGGNGDYLAQRLRERWPRIPILFMSGYSPGERRRHGAADVSDEIMQKPFTPDGLIERVTGAMATLGKGRAAV